jgi:Di-haem oxidoreductase, putative peroxidase
MYRAVIAFYLLSAFAAGQTFRPDIPHAWDDREVEAFQVPLAQRDRSPRFLNSREYYALKVRPIYRTYPVYAPGREPTGYMEGLKQKEPEIVFDASRLRTKQDWINAGELVFDSSPFPSALALSFIPLAPATRDGVIPYFQYVIRKKGVVELGGPTSCTGCHTRLMPDGTVLKGAQGDIPLGQFFATIAARAISGRWTLFGAPWITKREEFESITIEEYARRNAAMQPGVVGRHGTSDLSPSKVPSLIGLQDIKYLDSTGLMRHRSTGDLMRYAIVNYGLDITAYYGDFQPSHVSDGFAESGTRFSDEQLYALALYIYSLKPPPNANRLDKQAVHGQRVFQQQGCIGCHTPPLYTNNKLTPVQGFTVPEDLRRTLDILDVSVGTDPILATQTRRGTGFYKVPSLRGVWYRNAFGHSGQAETLEEWLDPERLRNDYVPKGFHLGPGPIKGHEFGLKLPHDDKEALIAFLKTL